MCWNWGPRNVPTCMSQTGKSHTSPPCFRNFLWTSVYSLRYLLAKPAGPSGGHTSSQQSRPLLPAHLLVSVIAPLTWYVLTRVACNFGSEPSCECVCLLVCPCIRGQVISAVDPQELFTLCFEKAISVVWSSVIRLDWLPRKPQGSTSHYLPSSGIISMHGHAWLLIHSLIGRFCSLGRKAFKRVLEAFVIRKFKFIAPFPVTALMAFGNESLGI